MTATRTSATHSRHANYSVRSSSEGARCIALSRSGASVPLSFESTASSLFQLWIVEFLAQKTVDLSDHWKPRTSLGQKLMEHRNAALRKGMRLMSLAEINAEIDAGRRNSG